MKRLIFFLLLLPSLAQAATCLQVEQFLAGWTDNSGVPLNGGLVYSYAAGTATPQSLYTDKNCSVADTNPVVLDSNGRKLVYANSALSYKFIIKTPAAVTLYTLDNLFYPRELFLLDSPAIGYSLYNDTVDGADSERLAFGGGGASPAGRGSLLVLYGNEVPGNEGRTVLSTGTGANAPLDLVNTSSTGDIRFSLNNVARWEFDGATNALLPMASDSYDIGSAAARIDDAYIKTVRATTLEVTTITNTYSSWTPVAANYTLTDGAGTMSWSVGPTFPAVPALAAYHVIGKTVILWHYFFGTFGGTAEKTVNFPLPVTAVHAGGAACHGTLEGVGIAEALFVRLTTTSNVAISRTASADYPIANNVVFRIGCTYAVP